MHQALVWLLTVVLRSFPAHHTQKLQQCQVTNRCIAQRPCRKVLHAFSHSILLNRVQQGLLQRTLHCSQWQCPQLGALPTSPSPPRRYLQQRMRLAHGVHLPIAKWAPRVAYVAPYSLDNDARSTGFYTAGVPPPEVE